MTTTSSRFIQDFVFYLHDVKRASDNTIKSYRADLVHFEHFVTGRIGEEVCALNSAPDDNSSVVPRSPDTVQRYLDYLGRQNYSGRSIRRKLSTLKTFCAFLVTRGALSANPATALQGPPLVDRPTDQLTFEQAQRLLAAPGTATLLAARDTAILDLLYSSGIRPSELVQLKLDDLDLNGGEIQIRLRNSSRSIPVGPAAIQRIRLYLHKRCDQLNGRQGVQHIFLNKCGEPLTTRSVRRKLGGYLARIGLDRSVNSRTLRHTFAINMIDQGANRQRIQELLGVRTAGSTRRYGLALRKRNADQRPTSSVLTDIPLPKAA